MKKKNILNLIRYWAEKNDEGFREEAYEIARNFDNSGDSQLAEYIIAQLAGGNTFTTQSAPLKEPSFQFFSLLDVGTDPLPLPESIKDDVVGVVHAIARGSGINKLLFTGAPGTGKTETVKHLSRLLNRKLYKADFSSLVDSKLGQTQKNISALFNEMNTLADAEGVLFLFDEIDAIALDRTNDRDVREMGRVTSCMLNNLEQLNPRVTLIATTNLIEHFDKALVRRFDAIINFNRYSSDDLEDIADILLDFYLDKYGFKSKSKGLFHKILRLAQPIPMPGDLKNMIKTSIAFSSDMNGLDYLRRFYRALHNQIPADVVILKEQGFTVREIEVLSGVSKSQAARTIKGKQG